MSSSSSSSLKDFLTKHSIDEIEKDQELVYLSSNESIESAFQVPDSLLPHPLFKK